MRHVERPVVLGVDPRLVLVFELVGPVDLDDFRRAGLRVLDASDSRVVVAFADDPALVAFHERLDALQGGVPEDRQNEPYAGFFDAIESLRTVGPSDRMSPRLQRAVEEADSDQLLRIDIECWHPDDRELAASWLRDLEVAVDAGGGSVADRYVHDDAGLLLARAYVPARVVITLAELDFVARLDVLPMPAITVPQLFGSSEDSLPQVSGPAADAPVVGIVDSGVRSAHPLLAGAVVAADALGTGISEGEDRSGHGTMVAALVAHGSIEELIARGLPVRPLCRIVSARVLDDADRFPEDDLWERDLAEAIEWCVEQGATVINVSLGDSRAVLSGQRQTSAAAVIDDLARRHDVTIVTCTGNIAPLDYLTEVADGTAITYPADLLGAAHARLIDPAPAMLALTVGSLTTAEAASGLSARETVVRVPMGRPDWPSPFTRTGPGVGGAIKPELVERGGTLGIESGRLVDVDAELGVVSAGVRGDRPLAFDIGSSFAAPLVTRVAAGVKARFPDFSANLVRALVLASAAPVEFGADFEVQRPSDRVDAVHRLTGYGRPSMARAIESTSHRVVLVSEDTIPMDGVHVYELPIPDSFRIAGGQRGIDIALAYNPRSRARRLDYLSNRMEFHLVRGMQLEAVAEFFTRLDPEDETDLEDAGEDEEPTATEPIKERAGAPAVRPRTLGDLKSHICKLAPATTIRSRGANQLGRRLFAQRFDPERHEPVHLVVRNTNSWDVGSVAQSYALAVAMWRTDAQPELYAELEGRLDAVVELPVEIELRV